MPATLSARLRRTKQRVLMKLQDGRCIYCRKAISFDAEDLDSKATIEHLIPRSKGGTHRYGNILMACWTCNQARKSTPLPPDQLQQLIAFAETAVELLSVVHGNRHKFRRKNKTGRRSPAAQ